jgi:hypothetical protein
MVQRLIEVGFIIAHGSHGKGSLLPEIIIIDLSNRDIECMPYSVLQAAQRLSLGLERSAVRDVHFNGTDTDKHNLQPPPCFPGIVNAYAMTVLKLCRHLIYDERLDYVSDLDIIEILHAETAFVACLHLAHIVFEAFERV